ncbi:hypothetical protein [Dyella sp. ASV21]|uniref:hypothetical protein n=1 Tax=Dyella sp. ASV21 TaxID=2795114 RepID=UPI0018EB1D88|nr:hypothetical protein [Dyella sp. ASV21]
MHTPPLLEDPTYPGRTGGYVARITGKLMHEAAISGQRSLFLPDPNGAAPHIIYQGVDSSGVPVYEVPHQFYQALYGRVQGIHSAEPNAQSGQRLIDYAEGSYIFRFEAISDPVAGIVLSILHTG